MSPSVVLFVLFSSFISIWIWWSIDFIPIWSQFCWYQNSSLCGSPASIFMFFQWDWTFFCLLIPHHLTLFCNYRYNDFFVKQKLFMWLSLRIMIWIEATSELRKACHNQHEAAVLREQLWNNLETYGTWSFLKSTYKILALSILNKMQMLSQSSKKSF